MRWKANNALLNKNESPNQGNYVLIKLHDVLGTRFCFCCKHQSSFSIIRAKSWQDPASIDGDEQK